jgi:Ankyrin repeats (many copies)
VHFVPVNHDEMNEEDRQRNARSLLEKIRPLEIINPKKEDVEVKAVSAVSTGVSPLHAAAISGDLHAMRELLEDLPRTAERSIKGRDAIHYRDRNGWQAVHEAARFVTQLYSFITKIRILSNTLKYGNCAKFANINTTICFVLLQGAATWRYCNILLRKELTFIL